MAQFKNTNIDDTGLLQLPAGNTAQRPSSPTAGMIRYNTSIQETEYYDGSNWRTITEANPEASGGEVIDTEVAGVAYRIHLFKTVGNTNFTVTKGGEVEYLIVAGGGGGGSSTNNNNDGCGGGGGGGVVKGFTTITPNTYTITVGGGGAGVNASLTPGQDGGNSSAFGITALGGGGGATQNQSGRSGGSGGGAGNGGGSGPYAGGTATQPGSASGGYGNPGGNITTSGNNWVGSGGGGAGSAGISGDQGTAYQGYGGHGIVSDITGVNTYYGGGGGGGAAGGRLGGGGGNSGYPPPPGGLGGGAKGGYERGKAPNGSPNTGGGGGGGTGNTSAYGGDGGSGIVIVRYKKNKSVGSSTRIKSSLPSAHKFTASNPAKSARQISDLGLPNGWYWVDLQGPKLVYINTEFDGGGWYLITQNRRGNGGIGAINYNDAIDYKQIYKTQFGNEYNPNKERDLNDFNLWTGIKLWEEMTGGRNTGGQVAQIVFTSPTDLNGPYTKRATWTYTGFGDKYAFEGAANVSSTSDNPGLYSYHAANGYNLTTHDRDQDSYGANCANLYGGHPMWFGACWSGNIWGSTSGSYADAYFWTSSGGDNHNYGATYVRAL